MRVLTLSSLRPRVQARGGGCSSATSSVRIPSSGAQLRHARWAGSPGRRATCTRTAARRGPARRPTAARSGTSARRRAPSRGARTAPRAAAGSPGCARARAPARRRRSRARRSARRCRRASRRCWCAARPCATAAPRAPPGARGRLRRGQMRSLLPTPRRAGQVCSKPYSIHIPYTSHAPAARGRGRRAARRPRGRTRPAAPRPRPMRAAPRRTGTGRRRPLYARRRARSSPCLPRPRHAAARQPGAQLACLWCTNMERS
jgi:hypothetical protein